LHLPASANKRILMLPALLQSLPYLVHTNRELGLMLAGRKPLAAFADREGHFTDVMLRYFRQFDRHVSSGRFVRRDHFSQLDSSFVVHRVLFALPSEVWRLDAMIELKLQHWSDEQERREGELLGYENWMNDHWLGLRHPGHHISN
jgi:hypothetical protein